MIHAASNGASGASPPPAPAKAASDLLLRSVRTPLEPTDCYRTRLAYVLNTQISGKTAGFIHENADCLGMVDEVSAPHGERTILVTLRFNSAEIAEHEKHLLPGFCWDMGYVSVPKEPNLVHKLKTLESPIVFRSLEELPWAVGEALRRAGAMVVRLEPPKKP